jgi:hypothetical protein
MDINRAQEIRREFATLAIGGNPAGQKPKQVGAQEKEGSTVEEATTPDAAKRDRLF